MKSEYDKKFVAGSCFRAGIRIAHVVQPALATWFFSFSIEVRFSPTDRDEKGVIDGSLKRLSREGTIETASKSLRIPEDITDDPRRDDTYDTCGFYDYGVRISCPRFSQFNWFSSRIDFVDSFYRLAQRLFYGRS